MTVASLMFATSFPIAFTDHLVSNTIGTLIPPITPISGAETRVGVNGDIPVGLGLKLWESRADVHLLYAGSIVDANKILDMIELALQRETYSRKINQQIKRFVAQSGLNASFIVVYLSHRGRVSFCSSDEAQHYIDKHFRRVVMIGSGKPALVQIINTVSGQLKAPLPSLEHDQTGHVFQAIARSLAVVARSTIDYMSGSASSFAAQSTGGYFCISYFLDLYWRDQAPPAFLDNSLCQIFTEADVDQIYLTRLIVSQRSPGLGYMDVFVFVGRQPISLNDTVISLPLSSFSHTSIANVRKQSTHNPMDPLGRRLDLFQIIAYAALPMNGRITRTHTVEFSAAVAVDLTDTHQAIELTLHRPLIAKLWARLLKAF
ncbi:hypothetical protein [Pseudomonas spelaei]